MALRVLIFGDIVGRMGRRAVADVLPRWKERYQPDLTMANVENLAHGLGITEKTVAEILAAGIDVATSGNHVFDKSDGVPLLDNPALPLLRPANYPEGTPGRGALVKAVGSKNVLVVNLQGRVFMKEAVDDPFRTFDAILQTHAHERLAAVIVDLHAEATSEKVAFGWYVDGRASLVVGTHTHIPTADATILPNGTGYLTDLGMTGAKDSVIGVDKAIIIRKFLTQLPLAHAIPETGVTIVNALLATIDPEHGKTTAMERLSEEVTVS